MTEMQTKQEMKDLLNGNVKAGWALVDQDMAMKFLERNTDNYRKIDMRVVASYADDMRAGRWETNGEPIVFSDKNVLLNGQHRLTAIVKSGVPQLMFVIRGVPDGVTIFDVGKKRNDQDILRQQGLENASTRVIALGKLMLFGFQKENRITTGKSEAHEFIRVNYDILQKACRIVETGNMANGKFRSCSISAAILTALVLNVANAAQLEQFMTIATSGFQPSGWTYCPAIVFRNHVMAKNGRINATPVVFETAYRAICDYAAGHNRRKMYGCDGTKLEDFNEARRKLGVPV